MKGHAAQELRRWQGTASFTQQGLDTTSDKTNSLRPWFAATASPALTHVTADRREHSQQHGPVLECWASAGQTKIWPQDTVLGVFFCKLSTQLLAPILDHLMKR